MSHRRVVEWDFYEAVHIQRRASEWELAGLWTDYR